MTILALLTRRTNSFSGASKLAARASACSCNNSCSLDANQISWARSQSCLGQNLGSMTSHLDRGQAPGTVSSLGLQPQSIISIDRYL